MDEAAFREQCKAQGFDELDIVVKRANFSNEGHVHNFSVSALVLAGEFNIVTASGTITCHAGDLSTLDSGTPHHERCGPEGAGILAARRVT
ncbi:MAG: AraC family transcriptional regulator [Proteobacteria bacterium]|nr:AraC family transcriptional regulator [Pseudomonadota bacterium]